MLGTRCLKKREGMGGERENGKERSLVAVVGGLRSIDWGGRKNAR